MLLLFVQDRNLHHCSGLYGNWIHFHNFFWIFSVYHGLHQLFTAIILIGLGVSYAYYDVYLVPVLQAIDEMAANPATPTVDIVLHSQYSRRKNVQTFQLSLSNHFDTNSRQKHLGRGFDFQRRIFSCMPAALCWSLQRSSRILDALDHHWIHTPVAVFCRLRCRFMVHLLVGPSGRGQLYRSASFLHSPHTDHL